MAKHSVRTIQASLFLIAVQFAAAQPASTSEEMKPQHTGFVQRWLRQLEPAQPGPSTERQRFNQYIVSLVGPATIAGSAAGAGIAQWADSPEEWEQGGAGFGRRFGSRMAQGGVRSTITYFSSMALHEDNRYRRAESTGTWGRVGHAVASSLTAYHPDGSAHFSISGTAGIVGAAAISRTWMPESRQNVSSVGRSIGFTLAGRVGWNLFREFIPPLIHRHRK